MGLGGQIRRWRTRHREETDRTDRNDAYWTDELALRLVGEVKTELWENGICSGVDVRYVRDQEGRGIILGSSHRIDLLRSDNYAAALNNAVETIGYMLAYG